MLSYALTFLIFLTIILWTETFNNTLILFFLLWRKTSLSKFCDLLLRVVYCFDLTSSLMTELSSLYNVSKSYGCTTAAQLLSCMGKKSIAKFIPLLSTLSTWGSVWHRSHKVASFTHWFLAVLHVLKMLNSCLVKLILIKLFTSISHLKMNGLWGNRMRIPYMAIVLRTQSLAREWLSWKRHLLSNGTACGWTSVPVLWNKRTKFSNQSLDFQMHAVECSPTHKQTYTHLINE